MSASRCNCAVATSPAHVLRRQMRMRAYDDFRVQMLESSENDGV